MTEPTTSRADARRERNRADARREILDATGAILVEDGYDGFSMRKLALRCGCTAPTIYHYFGDKTRLIDALLEQRFAELVLRLRSVEQGPDPAENMRNLGRAWVHFGQNNPTHYQLLTQPRAEDAEPLLAGEEARKILERPMEELHAQGRIALGDPVTARQSIWALLHGLISLPAARPDVEWSADLLELSLEAVLRGWIRDPASKAESVGSEE
jgi:AcrR family transcriptional regulator